MKKEIKIIELKNGRITKEDRDYLIREGYSTEKVFVLPVKWEERFRTLVETLKGFTDKSDGGKALGICEELNWEIARLCKSLVYLINSTSYRKGSAYFEFDKIEIDSKLHRRR